MKIRGWYKKHPVAVVVGVFLLADVCLIAFDGESLTGSLLGTALAALVTLVALAAFVPQTLQRRRSSSHRARLPQPFSCALVVALVVFAGLVGGLLDVVCIGNVSRETLPGLFANILSSMISCDFARVALAVALCIATALFEEGFFRGLLVPCVAVRTTALRAAVVSALVFGALHVLSAVPVPAPTPTPESALSLDFAVLSASAVLKTIQATLFGFCMAALFLRTGSIWMCVFAHAAFDALYFAPHIVILGELPMTYLSANPLDLAVLAVTIVLLLLPSGKCLRWLRSNVVTYTSLDE